MIAARKLAAILAADVVGYSRLMGDDEAGTARGVLERREAAAPIVAAHGGRIFKLMGDGMLIEFPSVVSAVECAIAIQAMMAERNELVAEDRRIVYRIGVNLGDVLVEGDDLLGDGVNVAARLEGIADPGGVCISGSAYEQVRGKIEADFLDLGEKALKNIARPVRAYAVGSSADAQLPVIRAVRRPAGPPRLSLVVLPFANIGGGVEQDYFVDGVTESLTTDLSRISGAFVIARNTAFAYKDKRIDARQIGRELNVRYVLEGSAQRSGDRMRVNVQLIEAESGAHLRAERFDKPVADLFDMQDEIVARLANQLSAEIVSVEARRAERTTDPDALDFTFRGFDWINKGVNPEYLARARECFDRSLEIDPEDVHAILGVVLVDAVFTQMYSFDDLPGRIAAAEKLALRALSLSPRNPMGHYCMGLVLTFSNRAEQGIEELKQVLSLNPNLAFAHAHIGFAKIVLGRAEEAEAHILEALRLSPRDNGVYIWYGFIGSAKLQLGDDEAAVPGTRGRSRRTGIIRWRDLTARPLSPFAVGSRKPRLEARAGLALAPDFTIRRFREGAVSDNPIYLAQRERIVEGLRKAGVPEDDPTRFVSLGVLCGEREFSSRRTRRNGPSAGAETNRRLSCSLRRGAHIQSEDLLRLPDAAQRMAAEGLEAAVAAHGRGGELGRDQNGPAERLAQRLDAGRFVDCGANDGEVEPVGRRRHCRRALPRYGEQDRRRRPERRPPRGPRSANRAVASPRSRRRARAGTSRRGPLLRRRRSRACRRR